MAAVGLIALLIVAASDDRTTAFSLDVPPGEPVAYLAPHKRACQGPLRPSASFQGVRAYLSTAASPVLPVTVNNDAGVNRGSGRDADACGRRRGVRSRLTTPVAAHSPIQVCFTNLGPGVVAILGAAATTTSGVLHVGSGATQVAMALVFARPHPASLLSLIPTLFSRAALFKASWVGAWTFWALCSVVLVAFGLAGSRWSGPRRIKAPRQTVVGASAQQRSSTARQYSASAPRTSG